MTSRDRRWRSKLLSLVLLCTPELTVYAAPPAAATNTPSATSPDGVDQSALMHDLTLTRNADGRMTMAMWLPDEFWKAAFRQSGKLTDSAIADYVAVLHPYILVAVLDAQQGLTTLRYTDADTLMDEVTIEDSRGATYKPLAPDGVSEEMRNFTQLMKPFMTNIMGAMGQHLEFLMFPSADAAGHSIADPRADGSLTVHLTNMVLRYRLPLGSILPPAQDPKTGESFPGSYHFNPYTGGKLVPQVSDGRNDPKTKPH